MCNNDHDKLIKIREQKAEIERLNKCVMSEVQVRKCCEDIIQETMKQTVKDMGKEIYKRVTDNLKMWLRERYDVEVE
jgi:predicted kinase